VVGTVHTQQKNHPWFEERMDAMATEEHEELRAHRARRRLDVASLALLVIGLVFGGLSYWLVADHGLNALIVVPSIVAAATGAAHITKREASRR